MRFDPQSNLVSTEDEDIRRVDVLAPGQKPPRAGGGVLVFGGLIAATATGALALAMMMEQGDAPSRAPQSTPLTMPSALAGNYSEVVVNEEPAAAEPQVDAPEEPTDEVLSLTESEYAAALQQLSMGRADAAVSHLSRVLELDPAHANARYQLGLAHVRLGNRDAARRHAEKLQDIDGNLASLLGNLVR